MSTSMSVDEMKHHLLKEMEEEIGFFTTAIDKTAYFANAQEYYDNLGSKQLKYEKEEIMKRIHADFKKACYDYLRSRLSNKERKRDIHLINTVPNAISDGLVFHTDYPVDLQPNMLKFEDAIDHFQPQITESIAARERGFIRMGRTEKIFLNVKTPEFRLVMTTGYTVEDASCCTYIKGVHPGYEVDTPETLYIECKGYDISHCKLSAEVRVGPIVRNGPEPVAFILIKKGSTLSYSPFLEPVAFTLITFKNEPALERKLPSPASFVVVPVTISHHCDVKISPYYEHITLALPLSVEVEESVTIKLGGVFRHLTRREFCTIFNSTITRVCNDSVHAQCAINEEPYSAGLSSSKSELHRPDQQSRTSSCGSRSVQVIPRQSITKTGQYKYVSIHCPPISLVL